MIKIIEIIEPSQEILDLYNYFQGKIKKNLPKSRIRLIGSFGVPMCGKKEIDILVEVENVEKSHDLLAKNGFSKGPIFNGEGFLHDKKEGILCEVHILEKNDKRIEEVYFKMINKLKKDKLLRERFEYLKKSFNGKNIDEYKKAKSKFLKEEVFSE
jgi:GrpB-like predicted nucleotidyltransferase (UPF0157 family)